ncbi:MAG: hypothetical protein O3A46_13745 [Candidatus Poribacteria bacterium]|nr:hypothetical protein [Candidatus Poribacteria bacterium]
MRRTVLISIWLNVCIVAANADAPRTEKIAYTIQPGGNGGPFRIWMMDPDGTDQEFIMEGRYPAWSPDGKRIAFVEGYLPNDRLRVSDPDGRNPETLFDLPGSISDLSWSADGTTIAFVYRPTALGIPVGGEIDNGAIYLIDVETGEYRDQTQDAESDYRRPSFTPDGSRIVFDVGYSPSRIWSMDLIDGRRNLIVDGPVGGWFPALSPDRSTMAYVSYDPETGLSELLAIRLDGIGDAILLRRMTKRLDYFHYPTWSPNGKSIAYVEARTARNDQRLIIRVLDRETGRDRAITADGFCTSPSWFDPDPFPLSPIDRMLGTWGDLKSPP